jgi:Mg-chelatase subunit ChlD
MGKQEWWKRTSAADDASVGSLFDDDWLDDFDFASVRSTSASASVESFWGRYGIADRTDVAARIAAAQKVVQGFVNTFATGDLPYRVTFSGAIATAGTSFETRAIVVSHKPLFDPTLDDDAANTVLTAMAVHEAAHVRYGRSTDKAVRAEWHTGHPQHGAAFRLANILDDVRIERRFVADYPGFADVFAPCLAYVARSGGETVVGDLSPLNLACAAARYADHCDWTGHETERDWWIDWSVRGTADDTTETHVAAVHEALRRIAATQRAKPKAPKAPKVPRIDETDGLPTTDAGEGTTETDEPEPVDETPDPFPMSADDASDDETLDDDDIDPANEGGLDDCFADGAAAAAEQNGEDSNMDEAAAQQLVESAQALVDDGLGGKGEVYDSTSGLVARWAVDVAEASPAASAAIRTAFLRSRTGHFDKQAGYASGRIDNRGIVRIAENDYRVFNRRNAPSDGRYLVWLLVDRSGSMNGSPTRDAIAVAASLAGASRGLPNLRLSIYAWSSSFRLGGSFGAARVWSTGEEIGRIGHLTGIGGGSTPDAETLSWATRAIRDAAKPGEQPVIIIASDGQGSLQQQIARGNDLVGKARQAGVEVLSVALGGGVGMDEQEKMYGPGRYIPWMGTIAATARPLGKMIARLVSGK